MTKLPSVSVLRKLKSSDAFQLLERRKLELAELLNFIESNDRRKLLKNAIRRIESHLGELGLN
jgi:hypothetical protein